MYADGPRPQTDEMIVHGVIGKVNYTNELTLPEARAGTSMTIHLGLTPIACVAFEQAVRMENGQMCRGAMMDIDSLRKFVGDNKDLPQQGDMLVGTLTCSRKNVGGNRFSDFKIAG